MKDARPDSDETIRLLERVAAGDRQALNALMIRHREELRRFVDRRLEPAVIPLAIYFVSAVF